MLLYPRTPSECVAEVQPHIHGVHVESNGFEVLFEDVLHTPRKIQPHEQVGESTPVGCQLHAPVPAGDFVRKIVGGLFLYHNLLAGRTALAQITVIHITGKLPSEDKRAVRAYLQVPTRRRFPQEEDGQREVVVAHLRLHHAPPHAG